MTIDGAIDDHLWQIVRVNTGYYRPMPDSYDVKNHPTQGIFSESSVESGLTYLEACEAVRRYKTIEHVMES